MKDCPRCRIANPDAAETCDCGYSFMLRSGGRQPVIMGARRVPVVMKIHALLVAVSLLFAIWQRARRYGGGLSTSDNELWTLVLAAIILTLLFVVMLAGKPWARIALGLLTIPVGLLILLSSSAREFTDRYYQPPTLG
jgi:hypothetical protein